MLTTVHFKNPFWSIIWANLFNPKELPHCRRLLAVLQHLIPYAVDSDICSSVSGGGAMWFPARDISAESLIIGALEAAFWEMDQQGLYSVWS